MELNNIEQLKALRYLNNLDVVEKSLYKEFELGHIDDIKFAHMLRDLAEQKRNLYKAIEARAVNRGRQNDNCCILPKPIQE